MIIDVPIFDYTPSTVKLSITGSGKMEMKGVLVTVRTLLILNSIQLAFNIKQDIALHHALNSS